MFSTYIKKKVDTIDLSLWHRVKNVSKALMGIKENGQVLSRNLTKFLDDGEAITRVVWFVIFKHWIHRSRDLKGFCWATRPNFVSSDQVLLDTELITLEIWIQSNCWVEWPQFKHSHEVLLFTYLDNILLWHPPHNRYYYEVALKNIQ